MGNLAHTPELWSTAHAWGVSTKLFLCLVPCPGVDSHLSCARGSSPRAHRKVQTPHRKTRKIERWEIEPGDFLGATPFLFKPCDISGNSERSLSILEAVT